MVFATQYDYQAPTMVIAASNEEWDRTTTTMPMMIPQSERLVGDGELMPMEQEYIHHQQQQQQQQQQQPYYYQYANESFSSMSAGNQPCNCSSCMPGLVAIPSSPEESFSGSISGDSTPAHTVLSTSTTQYTHDPYSVDPLSIGMPAHPLPLPPSPEVRDVDPCIPPPKMQWAVEMEFKHGRRESFEASGGFGEEPVIGQWYIVEGDRGVDLAMALSCCGVDEMENQKKMKKVIREASQHEIEHHQKTLTQEEEPTVPVINSILRSSGITNVHVYAAAYQLDKKKISFFYESRQRQPDFRPVLSECYAQWKCRIWFTTVPRRFRKDL